MTILLLAASDHLRDRLHTATGGAFLFSQTDQVPEDLQALASMLGGAELPDVALLHPEPSDLGDTLSLATQLDGRGVSVLLVSDQALQIGLNAMRSGVRDILDPEVGVAELRGALDRGAALAAARAPHLAAPLQGDPVERARGRVIAVASPKGGVGKTTTATNLAVGLARRHPQQVVLVDLDIHFGDVASALNLAPEYSLPDMVKAGATDPMVLKTYLAHHKTGLFVVPGSDSPAAADLVTSEHINQLLEILVHEFRFVVVDTAPGLSEHTLAALDHAEHAVLVTSLDVPGVRGLRKELDTLNDLGMLLGARTVVLNFNDPTRGLSVADVEATIRAKVDLAIPPANQVPVSVNQGIPLLQSGARDPITRQFQALVDLIDPATPPAARRGLFSGLSRRVKE